MSTQDVIFQYLNENERGALQAFVAQLRQRYGRDLQRVVLFGSKACGDFDKVLIPKQPRPQRRAQ
jgi:predicted nucleotidyltransferase